METTWIQLSYELVTISWVVSLNVKYLLLMCSCCRQARNLMRGSEERRSRFSREIQFSLKGFRNTSRCSVNKGRNYIMFVAKLWRNWVMYTKLQSSAQKISSSLKCSLWLFTKTYSRTRMCHLVLLINWLISYKTALWLCLVIITKGTETAGVMHFKQVHSSNKKAN